MRQPFPRPRLEATSPRGKRTPGTQILPPTRPDIEKGNAMRWFLALLITAVLTLVAVGLYVVAYAEPGVGGVSAFLHRLLPTHFLTTPIGWAIPAAEFACFALVRAALIR